MRLVCNPPSGTLPSSKGNPCMCAFPDYDFFLKEFLEWPATQDTDPLEMLSDGEEREKDTVNGQKGLHRALLNPPVRFASDEERRAAEAKCAGLEGELLQYCLLIASEVEDPKQETEMTKAFSRENRLTDCLAVTKQDAARFRNDLTAESKSFAFSFFLKPFEYPKRRERILFAKVKEGGGGDRFIVLLHILSLFCTFLIFFSVPC
jgi:hypothetical protein